MLPALIALDTLGWETVGAMASVNSLIKCLQTALLCLLFATAALAQALTISTPVPNSVFQSGSTILVTYATSNLNAELYLSLLTPDGNVLLSLAQGPMSEGGTQGLFVPPDFTGQAMIFLQDINAATRANVTVSIVPWAQLLSPMPGANYVIDSDSGALSISVRAAGVEGTWDSVLSTHTISWSYTIPELDIAVGSLAMLFANQNGCFAGSDYLVIPLQKMEYAGSFRVVATVEGFDPVTVSATFVKRAASNPPLPLGP